MRRLSVKSDGVPFDAERSEHGAERQIQIEQDRPLFDVQLEISRRILQFAAASP